jgi:tRNA(Arg) A34 adenosine deaminase TadA
MIDADFVRLALLKADEGQRKPGGAEVGCVIVKDGAVLQLSHNEVDGRHDPTAHAEMVAIRDLCGRLGAVDLKGCTLLHVAALRNVFASLHMGRYQPNRVRRDTYRRERCPL